jgi:hypothetical protein
MRLSAFQGEDYIAIGCSTGVYISKRAVDHSELSKLSPVLVTN